MLWRILEVKKAGSYFLRTSIIKTFFRREANRGCKVSVRNPAVWQGASLVLRAPQRNLPALPPHPPAPGQRAPGQKELAEQLNRPKIRECSSRFKPARLSSVRREVVRVSL
jgi:hypothetical protein